MAGLPLNPPAEQTIFSCFRINQRLYLLAEAEPLVNGQKPPGQNPPRQNPLFITGRIEPPRK